MEIIIVFAIGIIIGYLFARVRAEKEEHAAIEAWKEAVEVWQEVADRRKEYIDWLEDVAGFPKWEGRG